MITATSSSAPMYSAELWPRVPRSRESSRATDGSAHAPARAPAAIIASSRTARPGSTDAATESTRLAAANTNPGQTAPTTTISRRLGTPANAACHAPAAPPSAAAANTTSEPGADLRQIRGDGIEQLDQAAHEHEQRQQRRCHSGAGRPQDGLHSR